MHVAAASGIYNTWRLFLQDERPLCPPYQPACQYCFSQMSSYVPPVCLGTLITPLIWLTSASLEIPSSMKCPLHFLIDEGPYITCYLDSGKCVGYIPPVLTSFLHDLLSHSPQTICSKPAGGWRPGLPNDICPLVSATLETSTSNNLTAYTASILVFCSKHLVDNLCHRFNIAGFKIFQPHDYRPADHYGCPLVSHHSMPQPKWKPGVEKVSLTLEEVECLQQIPSGADLAEHEPCSLIVTTLHPHQKQGLAFLLDREDPNCLAARALWKEVKREKHVVWRHCISLEEHVSNSSSIAPTSCRGSILADDMGLGKTLQTISLISITLRDSLWFCSQPWMNTKPSQATLIVCPVGLIHTWMGEIEKHTQNNSLKVLVYHDHARTKHTEHEWDDVNVILTTYRLVSLEFQKAKQSAFHLLFSRVWFRVVLDEAQCVLLFGHKFLLQQLMKCLLKHNSQ